MHPAVGGLCAGQVGAGHAQVDLGEAVKVFLIEAAQVGLPQQMGARWQAPTRGAITQARQRLGTEPVKDVFQQVARPAATESTPGAWLHDRRVMAIDGFVVDLPDTEANVAEFGRDSAGGYETAFPQARVVAISECASHAMVAADVAGRWAGEQTLAFSL